MLLLAGQQPQGTDEGDGVSPPLTWGDAKVPRATAGLRSRPSLLQPQDSPTPSKPDSTVPGPGEGPGLSLEIALLSALCAGNMWKGCR